MMQQSTTPHPPLTPAVPLEAAAHALSLPTHALDTFTHWTPPVAPSLIIAVSFGLLIPARLLALAPHGGLNVHPSLLPDLRGAAPIPRAILAGRTHTGVSVQTLHPRTFDAGTVLAQTPAPGVSIAPDATADELRRALAPLGARMLVDVLRTRKFVAPLSDGGWYAASGGPVALAPKTRKADACVEFGAVDMARVTALLRALGHVWCVLPNGERLVVHGVAEWAGGANAKGDAEWEGVVECKDDAERHPGLATRVEQSQTNTNTPLPCLWPHPDGKTLLFRTACGRIGAITSSTYPGGPAGRGNKMALRVLREHARL